MGWPRRRWKRERNQRELPVNFPDCPHQTTGRNPIPARRKPRRNVARREKEWPDEKAKEAANTFLAFRYRHSNKSISFRPTPLIFPFFSVLYKFCDLSKRGRKAGPDGWALGQGTPGDPKTLAVPAGTSRRTYPRQNRPPNPSFQTRVKTMMLTLCSTASIFG